MVLGRAHSQRGPVRGELPLILLKEAIVHIGCGEVGDFVFELGDFVLERGDLGVAFAEEGFGLFGCDGGEVAGSGLAGVVELEEGHDGFRIGKGDDEKEMC